MFQGGLKTWGVVMIKHLAASRFAYSFLVCLAVLFLCVSPIWAQSGTTGALTGTVTDPSGGVIGGAHVTATNRGTGQERTVPRTQAVSISSRCCSRAIT